MNALNLELHGPRCVFHGGTVFASFDILADPFVAEYLEVGIREFSVTAERLALLLRDEFSYEGQSRMPQPHITFSSHPEFFMNYDVIGDIHGHADALEALLGHLGYRQKGGAWRTQNGRLYSSAISSTRGPQQR